MPLSTQKYNEFSTKLEKFCLDLGMTENVNCYCKFYCYDATNPIWLTELCGYPSSIVVFNDRYYKSAQDTTSLDWYIADLT